MPSPLPTFSTRNEVVVTGLTKTVAAAADAGLVQNYVATTANAGTACVFTLPAMSSALVGFTLTFRVGGPNNGDSPITVTPNASDGVTGLGFTAATGKGPQILAAVANVGDEFTLIGTGVTGTGAWYIRDASTKLAAAITRLP